MERMCVGLCQEYRFISRFDAIVENNVNDVWRWLNRRMVLMLILSIISCITFTANSSNQNYTVGGTSGTYVINAAGVVCFAFSAFSSAAAIKYQDERRLFVASKVLGLSALFYLIRFIISLVSLIQAPEASKQFLYVSNVGVPIFCLLSFSFLSGSAVIVTKLHSYYKHTLPSQLQVVLNPSEISYDEYATERLAHAQAVVSASSSLPIIVVDAVPVHEPQARS